MRLLQPSMKVRSGVGNRDILYRGRKSLNLSQCKQDRWLILALRKLFTSLF
jgi:hypothetical protein